MMYILPRIIYVVKDVHTYFMIYSNNELDVDMYRSEIYPLPGIY